MNFQQGSVTNYHCDLEEGIDISASNLMSGFKSRRQMTKRGKQKKEKVARRMYIILNEERKWESSLVNVGDGSFWLESSSHCSQLYRCVNDQISKVLMKILISHQFITDWIELKRTLRGKALTQKLQACAFLSNFIANLFEIQNQQET